MRSNHLLKLNFLMCSLFITTVSGQAIADSKRVLFEDNGHVYQRFDGSVNWGVAKGSCETKKGHLVTITSEAENTFIYDTLLAAGSGAVGDRYLIGMYESPLYQWNWVTGESWNYTNWEGNQPDHGGFYGPQGYGSIHGERWDDYWFSDTYYRSNPYGYICEWSKPLHISTGSYPDITGDGVDESLTLNFHYHRRLSLLQIYDLVNNKRRAQYYFGTPSTKAKSAVPLSDITGDGWPEVAVLYYNNTLNWLETVNVKQKKSLGRFLVLKNGYKPLSLNVVDDINGNNSAEFVVQGVSNRGHSTKNKTVIEVWDSETGELIRSSKF